MYQPRDIYSVGDDILIINGVKQGMVIYQYDPELVFKDSFFHFGRSWTEFSMVDKSLRVGTDSTLFLYTDWLKCTEFTVNDQGIGIVDKYPILQNPQNNVLMLNDSLVFYRALQEENPFQIYNYVSDELECKFGEFPCTSIDIQTNVDRDNVFLSNSVYNATDGLLLSFYESLPLIQVYDMMTRKLVREIEIVDCEKQTSSLESFYDGESVAYFHSPVITSSHIYCLFHNAIPEENPQEQTVLFKMDLKGNLISKYTLDRFCPIYTVSEEGIFYGISILNDEYVLCKTPL